MLRSLFECFESPNEEPKLFGMDLFWNRTRGEMDLVLSLMDVTEEQPDVCRIGYDGEPTMSDDAYVSARPQLRAEVRDVQRLSGEVGRQRKFWSEQIRQDRRC